MKPRPLTSKSHSSIRVGRSQFVAETWRQIPYSCRVNIGRARPTLTASIIISTPSIRGYRLRLTIELLDVDSIAEAQHVGGSWMRGIVKRTIPRPRPEGSGLHRSPCASIPGDETVVSAQAQHRWRGRRSLTGSTRGQARRRFLLSPRWRDNSADIGWRIDDDAAVCAWNECPRDGIS